MKIEPSEVHWFLIEDGHRRYLCGNYKEKTYKVRVALHEYHYITSREMDHCIPYVNQVMKRIRQGKAEAEKMEPKGKGWGQV